jgi:predicted SnoaL-like aldol condensation-catalyzing enzyme
LISVLTAAVALATSSPAAAPKCSRSAAENRRIVLDFYTKALVDKKVRTAFETYMDPAFIEHKPDIETGTREATIKFLEGIVNEVPEARWEIVRSVADDDLVAVHVRFRLAPTAPEYAIADFFRVRDCKIVEHWDVVAPPSDKTGNPHPRF